MGQVKIFGMIKGNRVWPDESDCMKLGAPNYSYSFELTLFYVRFEMIVMNVPSILTGD